MGKTKILKDGVQLKEYIEIILDMIEETNGSKSSDHDPAIIPSTT